MDGDASGLCFILQVVPPSIVVPLFFLEVGFVRGISFAHVGDFPMPSHAHSGERVSPNEDVSLQVGKSHSLID